MTPDTEDWSNDAKKYSFASQEWFIFWNILQD